ncbi:MAG: glycosyltransferase family 4 protein [Acidimicrobiales bacterium]
MSPEVGCLVVVAIAAAASYGFTFPIRKVAVSRGLVVQPDDERVHTRATPTAGGAGMALAFAVAILAAGQLSTFHADFAFNRTAIIGVLAALGVMALLGLIDDVRSVSPPAKVAGQVLGAMVLYFFGVTMTQIKVPFLQSYIVLGASILPLVTALWVIGIANAVNLIDGLDGLAAGVIAIGSGALCIYGLRLIDLGALASNNIGPLLAAACCGICLGFLPHNFHRAKIFMGDTGAMVLGLIMAAATMEIGGQAVEVFSGATYFFLAPLIVPFVILGVPILDTFLAVVRRAVRRTSVTQRDLEHLHYRLMRLGHGHRRAVILLWAWTLVLSGLVLYPTFYPKWNAVLPFAVVVLAIGLITIFRPGGARHSNGIAGKGGSEPASSGLSPQASNPDRADRLTPSAVAGKAPAGAHGSSSTDEQEERNRRAHRRRFARHHPPMRG